jgi:hypothetical protein
MESIMKDEILKYLLKNKLISTQQHGFLSKHSTVTNLLESLNDWTLAIKDFHSVDVAYIDYRKAFDSVCHSKLLTKLRGYGFGTNLINWIFAYLTDRTQKTCINGHLSSNGKVISGVPQGSVLGPILFLLYINDVIDIFDHGVEARLFADDLKLYSSITSDSDSIRLQMNLQQLEKWSDLWQLTISVKKCSILHISNTDKFNNKYTLCNVVLPNSSPVRDLGVLVDSKLKFAIHINTIVSRAYQRSNCIYRCFLCRDVCWLMKAFTIYVRPILEYASSIWNPTYVTLIDKLEKVQRNFTKRLPGFHNITYGERLKLLRIDSLEHRRLKFDLILCYKIFHELIELTPSNYFSLSSNSITRGHDYKIIQQHCRINARKHFFSNRIICCWNSLPNDVVCASSLSSFKNLLASCDLSDFYIAHS